jgi:carbamoyltransferase
VWHHILGNSKIYNNPSNWNPYLGYTYSEKEIWFEIEKHFITESNYKIVNDDEVIDLLCEKNIISVFGGGSESGRRALGNRSILADPRHLEIKDIVNKKVKHRQWFRPFAPSILREDVKDWFAHDIGSPYMSFALSFKDGMAEKVPAVVHFDDTARLQTVKKEDNEWYYNFIKKFKDKTGIPMVLNTSFNDREPIVETPENAIDCFIRTNIDYLYFRDCGILVSK